MNTNSNTNNAATINQPAAANLLSDALSSITFAARRADSIESLDELEFSDIVELSSLLHSAISDLSKIQAIQNQ